MIDLVLNMDRCVLKDIGTLHYIIQLYMFYKYSLIVITIIFNLNM